MQLAHPHKGWENEHLATFLLSRVAFVASPVTVSDDIGTDLFCTLFDRVEHDGQPELHPRRSIAVQVKSSKKPVDIVKNLGYIARLEVPYYLGVVDQAALTIELYSARFLPALLSLKGQHSRLDLVPVEQFVRNYRPVDPEKGFSLLCHKVAALSASDDRATTDRAAAALKEDSAAALQAIASRLNKEYVFEIADGEVEFFAGRDSAVSFRHAFFKRLAEAYANLGWLLDNRTPASDAEMDAFLSVATVLDKACPIPSFVTSMRDSLLRKRAERGNARPHASEPSGT
jgi:hypothetical protein